MGRCVDLAPSITHSHSLLTHNCTVTAHTRISSLLCLSHLQMPGLAPIYHWLILCLCVCDVCTGSVECVGL